MLKDIMNIAVYVEPDQHVVTTQTATLKDAALQIAYAIPDYRYLFDSEKDFLWEMIYLRLKANVSNPKTYDFRQFLEEIGADLLVMFLDITRKGALDRVREMTDEELVHHIHFYAIERSA